MTRVVPDFGARRLRAADARLLCAAAGVDVLACRLSGCAAVLPPLGGLRRLFVNSELRGQGLTFVLVHEVAHVVGGHADELTELVLDESRYPFEDRVADLVAGVAVTAPRDRSMPASELRGFLESTVVIQSRAWQRYRVADVAAMLEEWGAEYDGTGFGMDWT